MHARATIVVEGESDRLALLAVARRIDRNLSADGVVVMAVGGAGGFGAAIEEVLAEHPPGHRLAGLCDEDAADHLARTVARLGLIDHPSVGAMEASGFHVCRPDLEVELIRALGTGAVETIIEEAGELRSLRSLRRQPAWRGRPLDQQLRRFLGSQSGRSARYAPRFVESLEVAAIPAPLTHVFAAL